MQSLKKIGQKQLKLESRNEQNVKPQSRAITLRSFDEIYPSSIPNHSLPVSTNMQSLKKISQKLLKLESGIEKMQFLTSIKGHNSKVIRRNLPSSNPKPLLADINSYAKFKENRSKTTQVRERKRTKSIFNINQGP